ncbi:hypothetical protein COO91_02049 [Nostoc flagelliforme CCNUN1]|uniref:Uncharacterized protein n=1 Tax=Nostoc flagelliforme CCNUN1 TaxID=2038116 RepID=A0A2K8SL64_9NOSO|nr:hypothetical protein COO91_02049 [Nostoc flagelliforme CCNUN1]
MVQPLRIHAFPAGSQENLQNSRRKTIPELGCIRQAAELGRLTR